MEGERILPELPKVEELGLNRVNEGPPLPKGAKWPEPMANWMREHWPGVPIPREWGEEVMKYLPLGLGRGVQDIVNSLGL